MARMADLVPKRIQRSRAKGWRMPEGAVYVGRPTIWGNPFIVGQPSGCEFTDGGDPTPMIPALTLEQSLAFYRDMVRGFLSPEMHPHGHRWIERFRQHVRCWLAEWLSTLRGHGLICWCPLDRPCHADILLDLAND